MYHDIRLYTFSARHSKNVGPLAYAGVWQAGGQGGQCPGAPIVPTKINSKNNLGLGAPHCSLSMGPVKCQKHSC